MVRTLCQLGCFGRLREGGKSERLVLRDCGSCGGGCFWFGVCPVGGMVLGVVVVLRRCVHAFIVGLGAVFVYYHFVSGRFSGFLCWAGWSGLSHGTRQYT